MGHLGGAGIGLPLAIAVATSGCSSVAPAPVPPGSATSVRQYIDVTPHKGGDSVLQTSGFRLGSYGRNEPTIEAACTASNDRGSWTIAAPGRLEVISSTAPLKISCSGIGYRESSIELKCRSPMSWTTGSAAWALTIIPLGFLIGVPLAAAAIADTPDARDCLYTVDNSLQVWLVPLH